MWKPCVFHLIHSISEILWCWSIQKWGTNTQIAHKKTDIHLFVLSALCVLLNFVWLPLAWNTHAAISVIQTVIKLNPEQSCLLIATKSLMGLPSPLLIMFIKISLILPPRSLHQTLFMLFTAHIHAEAPYCFYLQPRVLEQWKRRTDVTAKEEVTSVVKLSEESVHLKMAG